MTHLVYPGANHTRFHHALGAMYLMTLALDILKQKGNAISSEEYEASVIAILLHDIGHGPFSHALEKTLTENLHHEELSYLMMQQLNTAFDGKLSLAMDIFKGTYPKQFLHQLVSSQLDMDRLDYLVRDSFFTGVSEGIISCDRIIKMLNVHNDTLVVEEKGIYSIEKFIIARRLMYWQVYLHKTVLSAENMLIHILKRAKELSSRGINMETPPSLQWVFDTMPSKEALLNQFVQLDDNDIIAAIKRWQHASDKVLSMLCRFFVERNLLKSEISRRPPSEAVLSKKREQFAQQEGLSQQEAAYFVFGGSIENSAYNSVTDKIFILQRNGTVTDLAQAAKELSIPVMQQPVVKYFMCFPKGV